MGLCLSVGHGHHHHGQYLTDDDEDGFCTPECVSSQGESHNPSGRYSFEFPTPPRISADVGDLGALGSLFCKRGNRSRSTLDMFLGGPNTRNHRVHHVNQLCTGDYSFASYLASPLLKGFDVHAMEAVAKSYAESAAKAAARDAFVFLEENDVSVVSASSRNSIEAYHDAQVGFIKRKNERYCPSAAGEDECEDEDDDLAKSVSVADSEEWEDPKKSRKTANLWLPRLPNEEGKVETFDIFTSSSWEEHKSRKVENAKEEHSQHEEPIAEITDKFTTSQWEEPKKPSKGENLWVQQNEHEAIAETTDKFTTSQWEEPKKPRKVEHLWVQQNQNIEEAIDKTINKFNNNKSSSNFSFWVSDNNVEPVPNEGVTNERFVSVLNSIQARAKARRRQRWKSSLAKAHGAGTPERVQRCGSIGKGRGGGPLERVQRCGSGGKAYGGGPLERFQRCGSVGKAHGGGAVERFQRCGSIGKAPGAGAPEIIHILQRWGSIGRAHGTGAPEIIQRLQRWGSIGKAHTVGTPERVPRSGNMGKAHGTKGGVAERLQRCGSDGRKKTVRFTSDTRCPPNSPAELLTPHPAIPDDALTVEDFSAIGREVWEKVRQSPSLYKHVVSATLSRNAIVNASNFDQGIRKSRRRALLK